MTSRAVTLWVGAGLLAAGAVGVACFLKGPGSRQVETSAPESIAPERPRPVPEALAPLADALSALRDKGDFANLADRYPALLDGLSRTWGPRHPDLALYHYDFARSLIFAQRVEAGLAAADKALGSWPNSLPLQLLEARTRLELALRRGGFDARADQLLHLVMEKTNQPRLRGLATEPASLAARWAEMLFQAGRHADGLAAAEIGLSSAPRDLDCRAGRARGLMETERWREAVTVLQELTAERDNAVLSLQLGLSLLNAGEAAPAWERFARLLKKERTRDEPALLPDALMGDLWLHAGRALHQLERPREAVELLLDRLLRDPDDEAALHHLSLSLRVLGRGAAALAINRRQQQLLARKSHLNSAMRARSGGQEALAAYWEAQAFLVVDRLDEALARLSAARGRFPQIPQLHQELSRVLALLGHHEAAEGVLREGVERSQSPVLFAELARATAVRGRTAEARSLLDDPRLRTDRDGTVSSPTAAQDQLSLARARAFLELGDASAAKAVLDVRSASSPADDAASLLRAEIAIAQGRHKEADTLLAESDQTVPGASAWAAALRTWGTLVALPAAPVFEPPVGTDPSDLLDAPRLVRSPLVRGSWIEGVRDALTSRDALFDRMRTTKEGEDLKLWEELWSLYRGIGASRKSRELAWYLLGRSRDSAEAHLRVAATLSAPEECVVRLWALRGAERLAPGRPEIRAQIDEARAALGLGKP